MDYASYTRLKFDRPHPKVLRITMDNGKVNSADRAMHAELTQVWRDVDADPSINAAILTGAGKVFSAGGDFGMIQEIMRTLRPAREYGKKRATWFTTWSIVPSRW